MAHRQVNVAFRRARRIGLGLVVVAAVVGPPPGSTIAPAVSTAAAPAAGPAAPDGPDGTDGTGRTGRSSPYLCPVPAGVIIDHFHAPAGPYAPGNRGVDVRTPNGSVVRASADGRVVFAGQVAGTLHITILHPDGLRTTYSFLAAVLVRTGDQVSQGATIGITGTFAHFGVRDVDGTYLDPEALWAGRPGAHLVAGPDEGGAPFVGDPEVAALVRSLVGSSQRSGGALAALAYEVAATAPGASLDTFSREAIAWVDARLRCTSASTPVPPPSRRRVVILVGGLGSTGASAAVDRVDTAALGYAPADVVRFSYRGGRVPDDRGDHGALDAIATRDYQAGDTGAPLDEAAGRLADLIPQVQALAPGVPIDVIAHSQGGVIARLAVAALVRPSINGRPAASVDTLVTLGTPHQGTELATALAGLGRRSKDPGVIGVGMEHLIGLGPDAPALRDLSQTSDVIRRLSAPVPAPTRLVSIGASGDLTVPAVRTSVPGATNVVVHLGGLHAHDALASSPAVTREVGLALAGADPTCVGLLQSASDLVTAHAIAQSEAVVGVGAAALVGP